MDFSLFTRCSDHHSPLAKPEVSEKLSTEVLVAIIWFFTTFAYVQALCALHDFSNGTCHHERLGHMKRASKGLGSTRHSSRQAGQGSKSLDVEEHLSLSGGRSATRPGHRSWNCQE